MVKSLEAQGVEYVFGIPGAKVDKVFDTLLDSKIKTIVCRHEQNAAFIASGIGRMTGKAGVALVTSGPGCSNLVTAYAVLAGRPSQQAVTAVFGKTGYALSWVARAERLGLTPEELCDRFKMDPNRVKKQWAELTAESRKV